MTTPVETRLPRLAALTRLPVFLDLGGRAALVVGGDAAACWKAELLAAAGAHVRVVAETVGPEMAELIAALGDRVSVDERAWRTTDIADVAIAVASLEDPDDQQRFADAARHHGVLANIIDVPAFGDVQFGTIVNRSPVVVAISTDGGAPILGQALRRRIEAVLPTRLGAWVTAGKAFRPVLRRKLPARSDRRRFWEAFVDKALDASRAPETEDLAALASRIAAAGRPAGEVVLVGAGPGDPELLTLKAVRELQAADVVLYDRLVTAGILDLARREARRIHVGKEGHGAACRQEDIAALMVDLALAGQRVVRLKGGDPSIFGRSGEEIQACRKAGVPVRIVPGVTTASAAAAELQVSLTHRGHAQRVQFVTGHDQNGRLPQDLDIQALADPKATTIVYMGLRTGPALAAAMLASGLDGATPVMLAANVSRANAHHTPMTVRQLAEMESLRNADGPALLLIGGALKAEQPAGITSARDSMPA